MPTNFEFVETTPSSGLKPGKDSRIRSRCMQGRNKREGSRRSLQERKKREREESPTQVTNLVRMQQTIMPPSLGSEGLVHFACPVDPDGKGLLLKAFAYNVSNQPMTPLTQCVDFDELDAPSFQWLYTDEAFVHSVLCSSYAVNDFTLPSWNGQPGRDVVTHMGRTLALLAKKMDAVDAHQDEVVLCIIINLVILAAIYGDWKAASAHFAGLQKIVQLRGGITYLKTRSKLHFKLDRCVLFVHVTQTPVLISPSSLDLAWSLSAGRKPFFLQPSLSWSPIVPAPSTPRPGTKFLPPTWDPRLLATYQDLQHLSASINAHFSTRQRIPLAEFQHALSSIQSRLISLHGCIPDPQAELLRLALLAYLTTTFKVPGRKIPYTWIGVQIKNAYGVVGEGVVAGDEVFKMWVLMVVAVAVTDVDEAWLVRAWAERARGVEERYADVKGELGRVMWVDCMHDRLGVGALERMVGGARSLHDV